MEFSNFKRIVPVDVQEKIKQLVESIDFRDLLSGYYESIAEQEIFPIEGNYRDGWIPNQHGGYSVEQFYLSDMDSCRHFTEKQTDWMDRLHDDMLKSFCHDNGIEEIDYDNHELLNQLCDYENEWFQPALLQFQVFVERADKFDDESSMNVVCRLSINYKDAPYYREKYAEDILFRVYDYKEFMQTENCAIIAEFKL